MIPVLKKNQLIFIYANEFDYIGKKHTIYYIFLKNKFRKMNERRCTRVIEYVRGVLQLRRTFIVIIKINNSLLKLISLIKIKR